MGTQGLLGCVLLITCLTLSNAGLVKKILRHRRQTLASPEDQNITLPRADHPLVFNHVYNINVPGSSLCSVDLDTTESTHLHPKDAPVSSGHHMTEYTLDGENQIVFTHRINIPRQACGCTDHLPGLKALMSRLEMLEGEVSALRDQCHSEGACCSAQVKGEVGTKPYCNGHGNFSAETCGCICEPGWKGPNCTEPECPKNCRDRGHCVDGKCKCFKGFAGEDCSFEACSVDCSVHGQCVGGVCVCTDGFFGEDCSQSKCLNNCLGRGRCDDGDCVCDEPWTGFDCSELICPKDCYDRGRCLNGTCYCDEGFAGEDCGERICPNNCRGNGFCVDGQCVCTAGYSGEDCSQLTCLNDCNGRGTCFSGMCICDTGYQGEDCSQLACLNNCNNRGQCINGQCACDVGFQGDDCSELSCPNSCLHRGRCLNGQCVCEEGFAGEDCSIRTCPSNCYGRGECSEGRCLCHAGFTGEDCSELSCPNNCRNHGRCINGQCVCDEGFAGEDCSQRACPNDCLTRGYCVDGECICHEGYSGDDCSVLTCPDNCNNRGRCVDGRCMCEIGYEGESCAMMSCINNCQDKGHCVNGQCVCDEGYIGEDCSQVSPPKDLTVGEVTSETVGLSWNNEMLVTEYLVTYVPTIPGGLLQEFTVSGDKTAATVKELEPGLEYLINVYAVLSNKRSIPVSARVATDLPQPEGLRFKSVRETSVEVIWDELDIPFDGWEIYFRNMKEENGKVSSTLPPSQNQFFQSGLGPGQEYEVSINIIKNNTRGPQTTQTFTTKIDSPQQVEVKDITDSSALISWSQPVAPMDGITMFYMPSSDPSDENRVDISPPDKQYSIDGLRPDTEYTVSLISRSGDITSDPVTATFTTALDAPTNLQTVSQTDNSITLEWTNSEADISSYRVKYSPISGEIHGEEVFKRGPGDSTQATITRLKPGTEYGIGVTAVKNERESLPATTNAATDLDPPRDFEEIESTETSLSVKWQKPQAKISGYTLAYISRDGQVGEVGFPAATTTYHLPNLTPGMSYTLTLTAERGHKRSTPVSLSTSTEMLTPMVVNLTISDITWDGFTASWSPTSGDFDSFVIEVTNLENFAESQNLTLSGDALSLGISGLNPNTSYMVGLYGMYQGSFLEPVYSEATTVNQPVVGKIYIMNLTSESFSILWNGTEGEFDGFVLEIIDSDWLMEPKEYNISHDVKSYDVTGLRPSTDYIAYLYGTYKGSRTSAVSIVASTAEEPDLSKLVVSNITSDRFSLSWRTREKAFDKFIVEVRESALPSQAMGRALPGDVRSTVMAGLKASTGYNIKLYATGVDGQNTQPLFAVATTEDIPQLGPIAASSASPHNLSLSWSTVSGHFDGFVIRVSDSEQQSETLEFRLPGDVRNITVTNLMDATGYDIELYGISHGRHTPTVLAHAVTAPLPKVENLTISNITPYGFRVSWGVKHQLPQDNLTPSSGGFSHFHIVVTDSGWLLKAQEFTVPGNQSHLDIGGLITGIGYEVRLTGVSESGLLSRPLTAVAVTEAEPEVEHLFVSDVTADSFRLTWTANEDLFDRFVIKIRDSKRLAHPQEHSVRGDERTKVITGLMGGSEYEIELYGATLDRRSQPITGVVQTGLSTPRGLHFSEVTDSSAVVHWSMPRSPVDNYRITYVPFEGGSQMTLTVDGSVFEALLPNMIPGKTYQVTVSALKGLEESDPSTDTVTTGLDRPRGLTVINVTDTSALLLWQPSVATVDGYIITYSADSVSPTVEHVSGNIVEFEMNSLVPATHYTVGVHAMKEAQRSASAVTEFTTDVDPPRDLIAMNIQTDSATLKWRPPHAAVTGYMLSFSSADGTIREVMLSPTASSYSMSQLTGSTEYNVRLQAAAGAQRSRHVATVFTTLGQLYRRPRDCAQILLNGETTAGLYTIYIGGEESQPIQVYCDMTTDGGGWLVFLRRQNGKLEFFRNWKNYTAGFGNMNDEFWLGLSNLHKITSSGHYELRVDLRDNGENAYAQYDKFTIAEPRTRYKIYIGTYSGTAGDSMTYHQGRPFSTYDNDNDIAVTNCALSYKGAFWYKNCHRVNLMGKYGDKSHSKGINWFHWKGHEHSIQFAEMKIRPANFRNFESRKKRS
ncbi:tenascin isoform X2 [Astatotilapia calliptera]|uniref:tenascin isoform X2 n=1 Tax=Astatotilapia calliptera TaxID=8154 RepID=UPI000E41372C|nr:tenascin-like isoform X2 [Astatotilapia calliptera]